MRRPSVRRRTSEGRPAGGARGGHWPTHAPPVSGVTQGRWSRRRSSGGGGSIFLRRQGALHDFESARLDSTGCGAADRAGRDLGAPDRQGPIPDLVFRFYFQKASRNDLPMGGCMRCDNHTHTHDTRLHPTHIASRSLYVNATSGPCSNLCGTYVSDARTRACTVILKPNTQHTHTHTATHA